MIMCLCIYVVAIEPYFLNYTHINGQFHMICRIAKMKVEVEVEIISRFVEILFNRFKQRSLSNLMI